MRDEASLNSPFIMVNVEHGKTVLAKWQSQILFDDTHNNKYKPLGPFVFEARAETDKKKRTVRLYVDGDLCLGSQWHYDLESAFLSAEYHVNSYMSNRK